MFNITHYQRKASQNNSEVPSHAGQNGCHRKVCWCCCCKVIPVKSNSVQSHRRQPIRLPRPWDFPGKSTGVFPLPSSIKKSTNNKCWRGCGGKGTLLHCWWECKLIQAPCRKQWRFLKKLEIEQQSHCWAYTPRKTDWKRHVYPNVNCHTFYSNWDMEAI